MPELPHPTESSLDPSLHPLRDALRDRYILEAEIGAGGMGTVLRARDLKHSRTVAIKVLRSDMARSIGADRFNREIQTAARLMHPNIVTVFDSGSAAGMLYFVMPYVAGESLRGRLTREGRLPVDDAVRITTQLAGALRYAHDAGVVHRDIKPENILLSDGHAWLVDFGVAQAAASSRDMRLTTTGLIVGSPQYVSPEQAKGEGEVDGRADLYSLGCVLYEMLAGRAPFEGKTLEATLLGHMTQPPPALPSHIPPSLAQIVTIVLAKRPDERFQNAAEFESALAGLMPRRRFRRRVSRKTVVGAGIVLIAIPVVLLAQRWVSTRAGVVSDAPVFQFDTTRYAVLSIDADPSLQSLRIPQLLSDALSEWTDIDVVDQSRIGALDSLSVGRAITGSVSSYGDSLRVYLELRDRNRPGVTLAKARGSAVAGADLRVSLKRLVDQLLATGVSPGCTSGQIGTRSLRALHACDQAFSALQDGDLARSDSMFSHALQIDEGYARAALWLALERGWLQSNGGESRPFLNVAAANAQQLDDRERQLLRAAQLLGAGAFSDACAAFGDAVRRDSLDYAGWLGIGDCHARDPAVIADAASPTGFSFRSSYHQAARGYIRAFEIQPTLMAAYRDRSFARLRNVLFTSTEAIRYGSLPSDPTSSYIAQAASEADTLVFRPFPLTEYARANANARPATIEVAVDRQRQQFMALVSRWTSAQTRSPAAWEAMAVAHEMAADPRAIEMIRRAHQNAQSEADRQRLAASEVVLLLKFALPDDVRGMRAAARMADSLLAAHPLPEKAALAQFAGLAMLLGRPSHAAKLARAGAGEYADRQGLPAGATHPALALLVYAAAGAPVDSIHQLEQQVANAIRNSVAPNLQANARAALLAQAAMVAAPTHAFESIDDLENYVLVLQASRAWQNRDADSVRAIIDRISAVRGNMRPSDLAIDATFTEAWLLAATGDSKGAIDRIDGTLNSTRWFPPGRMDFIRIASLVRAMALRAELAARAGDRTNARRWAGSVAILWSDAEPALNGVTRRMKYHARQ
jgi:eukaryotic-like serine/threonine-protein kinase